MLNHLLLDLVQNVSTKVQIGIFGLIFQQKRANVRIFALCPFLLEQSPFERIDFTIARL